MRPEQKWVFYNCTVEDRDAFIRVDTSLMDFASGPNLDWSVRVQVALREPREDGLTTSAEAAVLHELEDALEEAVKPAVFVGVLTNDGKRSWYFYAGDPESTEATARQVCQERVPTHQVKVGSFEDPEWSQYTEFLYPNDLAWQWIADCNTLEALRSEGDDGQEPRTISHWAYFESDSDRRAFVDALDGDRYRVVRLSEDPESEDEFCAYFETREPERPAEIYSRTEKLFILAREHGGSYDGWEVPVEKQGAQPSPDPPPPR